jgi:hypothetical protein
MPYRLEFDSTNRILQCRFEGRVTDEALKEYCRVAAERVARVGPKGGILDLSAVTSFEVSPETIRELAKSSPTTSGPSCPHIIVAPAPLIFGMARMFELQGSNARPHLHVVRTSREAWAILGVHEPKFAKFDEESASADRS